MGISTNMTMMTVYLFRTRTFAIAIFKYGSNRLTARDGFVGVPADYYMPVEQYAAATYTMAELDLALANGWLNQQEYDQVVFYKTDI